MSKRPFFMGVGVVQSSSNSTRRLKINLDRAYRGMRLEGGLDSLVLGSNNKIVETYNDGMEDISTGDSVFIIYPRDVAYPEAPSPIIIPIRQGVDR